MPYLCAFVETTSHAFFQVCPPLALWFLLHREGLFRDVSLGLEAETAGAWRWPASRPG
jgi:hypothetical protein